MARHPVLAGADGDGDRFYTWKGETYWSVTTLIAGGVPKYYLPPWYAKLVAELAHGDLAQHGPHARSHAALRRWARFGRAEVQRLQAQGELVSIDLRKQTDEDLALRWLKAAPIRIRDAAAELGSTVHAEAEDLVKQLALDTSEAYADGLDMPDWPDELLGHMTSFTTFLAEWQPVYLATEATVFHRLQAYGGTLDAIMRIEIAPDVFVVAIVDYKSGRGVHPEVGMQLAAYARADFMAGPDRMTEYPVPLVDAAYVLHLTPRGYSLRPVRIDADVWTAFLHAREGYRWGKMTAKTILGAPLQPWRKVAS